MPDSLIVDLKDAQVGVSIKIEDLNIPSSVKVTKKFESNVVATVLSGRKKGQSDAEESTQEAAAA